MDEFARLTHKEVISKLTDRWPNEAEPMDPPDASTLSDAWYLWLSVGIQASNIADDLDTAVNQLVDPDRGGWKGKAADSFSEKIGEIVRYVREYAHLCDSTNPKPGRNGNDADSNFEGGNGKSFAQLCTELKSAVSSAQTDEKLPPPVWWKHKLGADCWLDWCCVHYNVKDRDDGDKVLTEEWCEGDWIDLMKNNGIQYEALGWGLGGRFPENDDGWDKLFYKLRLNADDLETCRTTAAGLEQTYSDAEDDIPEQFPTPPRITPTGGDGGNAGGGNGGGFGGGGGSNPSIPSGPGGPDGPGDPDGPDGPGGPNDPRPPTDPDVPEPPTCPPAPDPEDPRPPTDPDVPEPPTCPPAPDPEDPRPPTDPDVPEPPTCPPGPDPNDPELPQDPDGPDGPGDPQDPWPPSDPDGPYDPGPPESPEPNWPMPDDPDDSPTVPGEGGPGDDYDTASNPDDWGSPSADADLDSDVDLSRSGPSGTSGGVLASGGPGTGVVAGPNAAHSAGAVPAGVLGAGGAGVPRGGTGGGMGMGMMPPMVAGGGAGAGAGADGGDQETWLEEDRDVWSGDDEAPPSILGGML